MTQSGATAWLAVDPPPPRGTVPCQLLDDRLAVVGELLADGLMHRVPSGHLLVTVARPGHEAIDRYVDLEPDGRYLLRFFRPRDRGDPRQSRPTGTRVRLQRQVGLGRYEPSGRLTVPRGAASSLKVAVPRGGIIVAELSTEGTDRLTVSLPPAREGPGTRLSRQIRISLEAGAIGQVTLEDDDLLRAMNFLHRGQLREARRLIEPIAEQLKDCPPQDPIEAVVVGYVLLATHELDAAAWWCAALPETESWLPDAFVIAAEWFAAGGYHVTASTYLQQLAEVGLPLFTYGYERAVSRLRLYAAEPRLYVAAPGPEKPYRPSAVGLAPQPFENSRSRMAQELARWDRSACDRTLAELARWSPSVDRAAPTLTVRSVSAAKRPKRRQWPTAVRLRLSPIAISRRGVAPERRNIMSNSTDTIQAADGGQGAPLRGAALVAAVVALILWTVFTAFMIARAGTHNEVQWTRLAYLFASVEAIAFGAAGALWGTTINRQRAEQAEQRAAANERDASNGRGMAASQIAEAGDLVDQTSESALQRMGAGPDRGKAEVLQRHAKQARMLFPDL